MRLAQVRKVVCFFASVLPLVYLVYLVYRYSSGDPAALGADPGKEIVLFLGGWALVLLLVTLSVSPLQDLLKVKLVPLRRMLGLFAFLYAALHVSAYCVFVLGLDCAALWAEVVKRPYITVGMLAFLGMVPMALTSTRGMQRRLGKSWKKLHRLIYPIAFLVIIHFFWQTRSDFTEPLMYSAALALLMGQRLLKDVRSRRARG
jgi:sulfoxide reductase heme-binding subunit YedZ